MRITSGLAVLLLLAAIAPPPASAPPPKDWTILVYMDADNNLESVGVDDFLEMASVNLGTGVNVVVQFDRAAGWDPIDGYSTAYGDWQTAKRYFVTQGMIPDAASALNDLGEVNMADPANLEAFVNWGISNYPATYYFLVLWDHGLGWRGVVEDESAPGDRLTAVELRIALASIVVGNGRRIDLLGNDACRMTLEIMYELAPYVDYFVGSEKDEPLEGWPYDAFLSVLAANPTMTPAQVAAALVDRYVESYRDNSLYSVALSAVGAVPLRSFVAEFDAFLGEIIAHEPYFASEVLDARNVTERYEEFGEDYDLWHFVANVIQRVPSPRLVRAAQDVLLAFDEAVLHAARWDNPNPVNRVHAAYAYGLSIFFPTAPPDPEYLQLALSLDTRWDEFLAVYRAGPSAGAPLWVNATTVDTDADGRRDAIALEFTPSRNGTVAVDVYWEDVYVFSREYVGTGNGTDAVRYALSLGGFYRVAAYLLVGGRIENVTLDTDLVIEQLVTFRGNVTGEGGVPLDGAVVILRNLSNNESATAIASAGEYEITVVYPTWFRTGDTLQLEVSIADRKAVVQFDAPIPFDGTVVRDVRLDTVGMGPWYAAFAGLGIVAAMGVALALYFRQRLRRFKEIP